MWYTILMNATRNKKKRKKRRQSTGLILTFMCTVTAVVIVGLGAAVGYTWFQNRGNVDTDSNKEYSKGLENTDLHTLGVEAIPEEPLPVIQDTSNEEPLEEEPQVKSKYADQISDAEYLASNRIYVREPKHMAPDGTDGGADITMTFAGDILFDKNYAVTATLLQNGGEISAGISPELIQIMKDSDIFMLNNEFPYSSGGAPTEGKQYTFRADPQTARYLNDLDVDLVSVANNHAYDYGQQAFLDTMSALDAVDVPYVGGGRNIDEASSPVYFIIGETKIGFLSATQIERLENPDTKGATETTPGVFRCWNNAKLLEKIAEVKTQCDYLVVYIHWGTESTIEIDWAQREQAPQMVNAGADLIIGDHPHVLQPITVINGVPVVYSLGNFWFNSKEIDTCLVTATINEKGLKSLQFIPCLQSGCKTRLLTGGEADRVIGNMRAMSPDISIDSQGYITY